MTAMQCPSCGGRLVFAIYAICTRCRKAMQPWELQGAINEAERAHHEPPQQGSEQ